MPIKYEHNNINTIRRQGEGNLRKCLGTNINKKFEKANNEKRAVMDIKIEIKLNRLAREGKERISGDFGSRIRNRQAPATLKLLLISINQFK